MRGLFFSRILSLAVLLALPVSSAFAAVAYVHELQGTMTGQYGAAASRALKIGDTLDSGVTLSTGDKSTAIVKFEDGQLIVLQPNTRFAVREYRYNTKRVTDSNIVFQLVQGGLRFVTGVIGATNQNAFKLNVGTATIGVRGTDADVHYDSAVDFITVLVDQGVVSYENAGFRMNIGTGQWTRGSLKAALAGARLIAESDAVPFALFAGRLVPLGVNNFPINVESMALAILARVASNLAAERARANPTAENTALAERARLLAESTLNTASQDAKNAIAQALAGGGRLPAPPSVHTRDEQARELGRVLKSLAQPTPTPTPVSN